MTCRRLAPWAITVEVDSQFLIVGGSLDHLSRPVAQDVGAEHCLWTSNRCWTRILRRVKIVSIAFPFPQFHLVDDVAVQELAEQAPSHQMGEIGASLTGTVFALEVIGAPSHENCPPG